MEAQSEPVLPRFYHANIHERRCVAYSARAFPLAVLLLMLSVAAIGVLRYSLVLLVVCAVFNVSMWLFICSVALFGIWGSLAVEEALLETEASAAEGVKADAECQDVVRHAIVFPNYEEDEGMLDETLKSLSEAIGSEDFLVMLAMEEREGKPAVEKARRLISKFSGSFGRIMDCYHEANLTEVHLDGSWDSEVPGKASNLKYAVAKVYEYCKTDDLFNPENVVLTVSDADCLFHPSYFAKIAGDFRSMRAAGEQHRWTMWQAPQLPFRNYYLSPVPARVWGYISSLYEFGGVSGLGFGCHHMVFSAYSLHMQLAVEGQLWDGDVIAEDHHAYIKAFLYSAWISASKALESEDGCGRGCRPALQVRPVMLPVKSTSVVDPEGYWQSWVARWNQALRHCQGVAELSYTLLATWDLLCSLPLRLYTVEFVVHLFRVVFRPIFIHVVPICQAIALGILTLFWLSHHRTVPHCPDRIWLASSDGQVLLCGLAGAWALFWPMAIPLALMALSNFLFLRVVFTKPAAASTTAKAKTLWHNSDGGIVETMGSRSLTTCLLVSLDCAVLMGPIMTFYGLFAEVLGCWNVCLRGNHFKYITATKATSMGEGYGSTSSSRSIADNAKIL